MIIIDSHQHFWKYDPLEHGWINDDMAVIRHDFLPENLKVILHQNNVQGCIAVQTAQSLQETNYLLGLGSEYKFIKGVVGWVNLESPTLETYLEVYGEGSLLKGFRHILQGEKQRDFCLNDSFLQGISLLERYNFTYDILIGPDQLKYIPEFVSKFPNQRFVLDHLGKPAIKYAEIEQWKKEVEKVAQYENVYCKVSGMVTEADLQHWQIEDIRPYLDVVVNAFGIKRLMYGSDWPVCLVAGEYEQVLQLVKSYFKAFSNTEKALFFGKNAIDFYRL